MPATNPESTWRVGRLLSRRRSALGRSVGRRAGRPGSSEIRPQRHTADGEWPYPPGDKFPPIFLLPLEHLLCKAAFREQGLEQQSLVRSMVTKTPGGSFHASGAGAGHSIPRRVGNRSTPRNTTTVMMQPDHRGPFHDPGGQQAPLHFIFVSFSFRFRFVFNSLLFRFRFVFVSFSF